MPACILENHYEEKNVRVALSLGGPTIHAGTIQKDEQRLLLFGVFFLASVLPLSLVRALLFLKKNYSPLFSFWSFLCPLSPFKSLANFSRSASFHISEVLSKNILLSSASEKHGHDTASPRSLEFLWANGCCRCHQSVLRLRLFCWLFHHVYAFNCKWMQRHEINRGAWRDTPHSLLTVLHE